MEKKEGKGTQAETHVLSYQSVHKFTEIYRNTRTKKLKNHGKSSYCWFNGTVN
jgi:hypothetical protein